MILHSDSKAAQETVCAWKHRYLWLESASRSLADHDATLASLKKLGYGTGYMGMLLMPGIDDGHDCSYDAMFSCHCDHECD